jgi:phosphonate transport system substrate-binding protein
MKKIFFPLSAAAFIALTACGGTPLKTNLSVFFVPSRDNATLVRGITFLPAVLKAELAELGYDFETVGAFVGTSYEAVGEALDAGTADIGLIPGGTYAVYADGENMDVALTATRAGLNKDSDNPKDWNNGQPTLGDSNAQVTYYRSIGVAGTSAKGRELAAKINAGNQITWADLQTVKVGVQSATSSAGRVYPTLEFMELYDKKLSDLPTANVIQVSGYGGAAAALASGQVDIAFGYADFRRDYATQWTGDYGRTQSIWAETDVVFVTDGIYNDTVTVSKRTVDDALQAAIEKAFINLVKDATPLVGISSSETTFLTVKDIFKVYSHEGYAVADDADYDGARAANALIS